MKLIHSGTDIYKNEIYFTFRDVINSTLSL